MREMDYAKIGNRIRQTRKLKGWSQEVLAEKCEISLSFIGHIERGTRSMSLDTFANICNVLEAGADELLWGIPGQAGLRIPDWGESFQTQEDSYIMYAKIMKSIAEIMGGSH